MLVKVPEWGDYRSRYTFNSLFEMQENNNNNGDTAPYNIFQFSI